ncbi:Cytoplasmic tRNA 2-thiolation protein 1 [Quillaja saponaria]|uniref:Cytoplasmic tRNA 2-thiolation protein 1 n=1 Tax=Quillaja saponaria TaxID=32244 RepID=A0AAD7P7D6_QUISA|nr:Cytoplasmic tRNA 2-thiolation protein 1 [Quillaja saponaria]
MSIPNATYSTMPSLRPTGHKVNKNVNHYQFQMPLHYPRFKKRDYETMPEWQLDRLLNEYGLPISGDVNQKRKFAMGAFLWPSQYE